jgi:hypothetical protein
VNDLCARCHAKPRKRRSLCWRCSDSVESHRRRQREYKARQREAGAAARAQAAERRADLAAERQWLTEALYAMGAFDRLRGPVFVSTDTTKKPLWRRAQTALWIAVRDGRLERPAACQRCGRPGKVEAHHLDYARPLEVQWLCPKCHHAHHKWLRFMTTPQPIESKVLGGRETAGDDTRGAPVASGAF